jgi:hypothetical protein
MVIQYNGSMTRRKSFVSAQCVFLLFLLASVHLLLTPKAYGGDVNDQIVLGGVHMCGDFDEAVQFLKPKDPKRLKAWEKARRKALKKNPNAASLRFDWWNPKVPFSPGTDRWIEITNISDRVVQVRVIDGSLTAAATFNSWAAQMEQKAGQPNQDRNQPGYKKMTWMLTSGIRVTIGYAEAEDITLSATEFVCTSIAGPGSDIF